MKINAYPKHGGVYIQENDEGFTRMKIKLNPSQKWRFKGCEYPGVVIQRKGITLHIPTEMFKRLFTIIGKVVPSSLYGVFEKE